MPILCWNEYQIETRAALVGYFTRHLELKLHKVNSAFHFARIETPTLVNGAVRTNLTEAAHEASREILRERKLPVVVWQTGIVEFNSASENYVEYDILYGNTTATNYQPIVYQACTGMVEKECGPTFAVDEKIFATATGSALASVREVGFWGGKCLALLINLDRCVSAALKRHL